MKTLFLLLFSYITIVSGSIAQENLRFQKPPKEILELADYQRAPSVAMDSKKEYMLLLYRNTYKDLDELYQEEMRLAGLRINPITNISSTLTYVNNIKLRKISENEEIQVKGLPENPRIAYLSFSPDEKKVAFTHTTLNGVELWVLDIRSATANKLTEPVLNANMRSPFTWFAESDKLLVRMLPKNRGKLIDEKTSIPSGPIVSVSDGRKAQNRTFQDLLKNEIDEKNFEMLITSELHTVDLKGKITFFMNADMYADESLSPNGEYLMITTIGKPFSYQVPLSRFPQKTSVYSKSGKLVKEVNDVPLTEVLPKGFMAVRTGKRSMSWRNDAPATLFFVEALDEGNPEKESDYRDALFSWKAPFNKEPKQFAKTQQRFSGITWATDSLAIVSDRWYDNRNTKTYIVNPENPSFSEITVFDRNYQDVYANPGHFETVRNAYGRYVLAMNENKAYLIGEGHSPEGQFPFVDEMDMTTLEIKRLYQSEYTDKLETLYDIIDIKKGSILVRIQSPTEYPNYYIRSLNTANKPTQITNFPNPFESLNTIYKEVVKYQRKDGVELSGILYLPADYDTLKKEKLPLLMWAYPVEHKDKSSAGQSTANPNEFTFPHYGSLIYWVTRGYAILDNASFPIVGEGEKEPNDTFIPQLVASAEAAIDALDQRGFIDRSKVAIGGHSYGAFMTANLLSHSNLFACGIARSGAYNRSLTPFGFQGEQRNYWEATEVYNNISPFMSADKMKTPLLLIHGEADNNSGTLTLQTERYFHALNGLGAPVRMVILPKEGHGYSSKENVFHLLWEQDQFFEKHLKEKK